MLSSCHFAINLSDLWPAFLRKQVFRKKKRWFPVILYNIATSHIHTLCIYFNMTYKHGTSFEKDLTQIFRIPRSWFPKIFANTFLGKQDFRKKESWTCCFFANCSWKINYSESEIQIPHDSAVVVHTFCTFTGQWRQAPEVFVGQRRLACLAEEVEGWVGQKPFHLTSSQKTLFKWCRDISGHEISQHILAKKN